MSNYEPRPKVCLFCKENQEVDFRDANILKKYIRISGGIESRRRTGLCAKHQRKASKAIKTARQMAILETKVK